MVWSDYSAKFWWVPPIFASRKQDYTGGELVPAWVSFLYKSRLEGTVDEYALVKSEPVVANAIIEIAVQVY